MLINNKIAVLSNGFIGNQVISALSDVDYSDDFAHYDFAFVKPLDEQLLHLIFNDFEGIVTIEDGTIKGGFGSAISEFATANNYSAPITTLGIPDQFIEHGTVEELQKICKIDTASLILLFNALSRKTAG